MLYYLILIALGTVISWVTLIVVIPIAQRLADFSMPPWVETAWKLAVIALAINLLDIALSPIHFMLAWIVPAIVFWVLMVKWFEVDLFGAFIIVIVSWVVRLALAQLVIGALAGLH